MAKRIKAPQAGTAEYSWSIYKLRGTPAQFIGIVEALDEKTAIQRAIDEFAISDPEARKRLIAQRRAT
jgi:hypothetical protein